MFDFSWGELILIGAVALIVIGPKELPTVLRTLGQWTTKIRRMASEFQGQFQEAMREAEMSDLKREIDTATSGFGAQPFDATKWEPKPESSAAPAADSTTGETKPAEAAPTAEAVTADGHGVSPVRVTDSSAAPPTEPAPPPASAPAPAIAAPAAPAPPSAAPAPTDPAPHVAPERQGS